MGDAAIHLLIDSSLLRGGGGAAAAAAEEEEEGRNGGAIRRDPMPMVEAEVGGGGASFRLRSLARTFSADAPLSEVADFVLSRASSSGGEALGPPPSAAASSSSSPGGRRAELLGRLTFLDLSYHPAKIATSDFRTYCEEVGPRSKTVKERGWFPSGKVAVLPAPKPPETEEELLERFVMWTARNAAKDEEFVYNRPDASDGGVGGDPPGGRVRWTGAGAASSAAVGGGGVPKPSEIFDAVERRVVIEDARPDSNGGTTKKKSKPRRTEAERSRRLDALLKNLEEKSGKKKKEKKTSETVRRMLLKSRSVGEKRLRMEDRFHLEVVRAWDASGPDGCPDEGCTGHRFFSRQAAAGKVASSAAPKLGDRRSAEFLVPYPPARGGDEGPEAGEAARYRRLPGGMTLHEAEKEGWVAEFGRAVIRVYALGEGEGEGPSKSVLESDDDEGETSDCDEGEDANVGNDPMVADGQDGASPGDGDADDLLTNGSEDEPQRRLQRRIHVFFQSPDSGDGGKKPSAKKKKPPSKKMRAVLMKSKAKGEGRVKAEDRVYLEVLTFRDGGGVSKADVTFEEVAVTPRFFSKRDDVRRVIAKCVGGDGGDDSLAELIVPVRSVLEGGTDASSPVSEGAESARYRRLPEAWTLDEAVRRGAVEEFGRVLVHVREDGGEARPMWEDEG